MKQLYSVLSATAFTFFTVKANATTINVAVSNFMFSPSSFTAAVGDVVVFTLVNGTHTATSTSVPSGAATFASPTMSTPGQSFSYTITTVGTYNFRCNIHPTSMTGTFTVTATGINESVAELATKVFPNPFQEKVTVKYGSIDLIEFYNVVGEKLKSIQLNNPDSRLDVDFEDLPAGMYFYRTYKDGTLIETRKIVKGK